MKLSKNMKKYYQQRLKAIEAEDKEWDKKVKRILSGEYFRGSGMVTFVRDLTIGAT